MDGTPTIDPPTAPASRLLDMAPDLLGAAGFDGLLQLVNPAWSATLGWSETKLRTTPYVEFVHPDDRELAQDVVKRLKAGENVDGFVCRMLRADGETRHILWSAHSGNDECFYLAGKDVTERQRMEDELALRAEKLERTNAELQDFAYIASHDLAEPLRMITSYLELLQRRYGGQLDETADEFIGYAVGGAVRMRALIDDLLTYSRVGSHELNRSTVDLAELLAPVLKGIERVTTEEEATIEIAEPLARVSADATQLAQLLQNLLINAVKFHRPGEKPRITVSCVEDDGGTRISVADEGIGIAPHQHERIFKMFARLHGRDEFEGTGIGLSVCRRIADRHGGRIWVDSDEGSGSVFNVWLPS
jgi:PAS domain S-box-containing protein